MADITISEAEYATLKASVTAKDAAEAKLNSFESVFQARFDALSVEKEAAVAALAKAETGYSVDRALMSDGVNDDGVIEFLKFKHSSAPAKEDGTKPAFGEWYTGYKETKPALLTPWLNKAPVDGDKPEDKAVDAPKVVKEPVVDASKVTPQGNQEEGKAISPQEISKMSKEQFKAMMDTQ